MCLIYQCIVCVPISCAFLSYQLYPSVSRGRFDRDMCDGDIWHLFGLEPSGREERVVPILGPSLRVWGCFLSWSRRSPVAHQSLTQWCSETAWEQH